MKFSEYLDTLSREEIKELYKDLLKKNSTSFEEILKKLKELSELLDLYGKKTLY